MIATAPAHSSIHAAPLWHLLSEQPRALAEASFFSSVSSCVTVPVESRRTVLLIPGLLATDRSLRQFARSLTRLGHDVHLSGLPRYLDWTGALRARLEQRLVECYEQSGEPVSVIGWSAGGILARELARSHPALVGQVITVGSPFRYRPGDPSLVATVLERLRPSAPPSMLDSLAPEQDRPLLVQPSAAIYSRTDGIAGWQLCRESAGGRRENIEVRGSHSGMSRNVAVLIAVADRLSQSRQAWAPFEPPRGTGLLFPFHPADAGAA